MYSFSLVDEKWKYMKWFLAVFISVFVYAVFIGSLHDSATIFINLILNFILLVSMGNLFLVYLIYELSALTFVPLFLMSVSSARVFWSCHLLYIVISVGVVAFMIFISVDSLLSMGMLGASVLSFSFFISSALMILILLKIPAYPFYFWLPEAHVEAPWLGSVMLASIILKYSLYFFLLFAFNILFLIWSPYLYLLGCLTIGTVTLTMLCVIDVKQFGAFLSLFHINLNLVALVSYGYDSSLWFELLWTIHSLNSMWYFWFLGILYSLTGTSLNIGLLLFTALPITALLLLGLLMLNLGMPLGYLMLLEMFSLIGMSTESYYALSTVLYLSIYGATVSVLILKMYSIAEMKKLLSDMTTMELLYTMPMLSWGLHLLLL